MKHILIHFFSFLPVMALKGLGAWLVIGFIIEVFVFDFSSYLSNENILMILFAIISLGAIIHFFQIWLENKN